MVARDVLEDDALFAFVKHLYRVEADDGWEKNPVWHAFEETGWPEGNNYCYDGSMGFVLNMWLPCNYREKISDRLISRQKKWRTNKVEHMAAHSLLLTELKEIKLKETK